MTTMVWSQGGHIKRRLLYYDSIKNQSQRDETENGVTAGHFYINS